MTAMYISRERLGMAPEASCFDDPSDNCLALTEPVIQDLCIHRGDTGYFMIIVTAADMQTWIDIRAATWDADIRVTYDGDPVGYFVVTPMPGQVHIAEVVLPPDISARLTGPYMYDVQMNLDGVVTTLVAGTLTVNPDVSRA